MRLFYSHTLLLLVLLPTVSLSQEVPGIVGKGILLQEELDAVTSQESRKDFSIDIHLPDTMTALFRKGNYVVRFFDLVNASGERLFTNYYSSSFRSPVGNWKRRKFGKYPYKSDSRLVKGKRRIRIFFARRHPTSRRTLYYYYSLPKGEYSCEVVLDDLRNRTTTSMNLLISVQ